MIPPRRVAGLYCPIDTLASRAYTGSMNSDGKMVIQPSSAGDHRAMKLFILAPICAALLLAGCVSSGPAISKSTLGNLDVCVTAPEGVDVHPARICVDGVFVGNVSPELPVLYLKHGKHVVTVELAGMKTYQQEISILGAPNHQFLDVVLEKK